MSLDFIQLELAVPLYQIGLLLFASTLALLFGRVRMALVVNYLFTLYWGYVLNREIFVGQGLEHLSAFTVAYFGFGVVIVLLAVLGFFAAAHH
ncbi:MAG: hypothetical protein QMD09_09930 [Desulfatibacillaceae bacterium]|nr:hypothetical protein [Desulfatibacillaceae bacterium]